MDTAKLQQRAAEGLLACRSESSIAHHAMAIARWYGYQDLRDATQWYGTALRHSEREDDEVIGAMSAWCAISYCYSTNVYQHNFVRTPHTIEAIL